MKVLVTILLTLAALAVGAVGVAYSGMVNISAMQPHNGLVAWFLSTTSDHSVEAHAGAVKVPDLGSQQLRLNGIGHYDADCAQCHGRPGVEPSALARGLNPPPPDLADAAKEFSPAELFWVAKHGIRMTGMPAWGKTQSDQELWSIVAFLQALPGLDAKGYEQMLMLATGHGDQSAGRDHGDQQHQPPGEAGVEPSEGASP